MLDNQYERLLQEVLTTGEHRRDRTGVGTISAFGRQLRYNLGIAFPLITTKKVHFKSIVGELLWFLSGSTNVNDLRDKYGVTIWDEWAKEDGDLGPTYGHQWRNWGGAVDQIKTVVEGLRKNPCGRRHIVSAWNPLDIPYTALPPCHVLFQFYVSHPDKIPKLSCQVYQRSADLFLGVPFNIASYALLTHIVANHLGYGLGELIWTGGDCHIYQNHKAQVKEQIARYAYEFPLLIIARKRPTIFEYEPEDFKLIGYRHHPPIKAEVAV